MWAFTAEVGVDRHITTQGARPSGVFAEFETNLRRERQMEGIAAAKAKGVYKGRHRRLRLWT